MKEMYNRGHIACALDAGPTQYRGRSRDFCRWVGHRCHGRVLADGEIFFG